MMIVAEELGGRGNLLAIGPSRLTGYREPGAFVPQPGESGATEEEIFRANLELRP
jgi:hypothetical protein